MLVPLSRSSLVEQKLGKKRFMGRILFWNAICCNKNLPTDIFNSLLEFFIFTYKSFMKRRFRQPHRMASRFPQIYRKKCFIPTETNWFWRAIGQRPFILSLLGKAFIYKNRSKANWIIPDKVFASSTNGNSCQLGHGQTISSDLNHKYNQIEYVDDHFSFQNVYLNQTLAWQGDLHMSGFT